MLFNLHHNGIQTQQFSFPSSTYTTLLLSLIQTSVSYPCDPELLPSTHISLTRHKQNTMTIISSKNCEKYSPSLCRITGNLHSYWHSL